PGKRGSPLARASGNIRSDSTQTTDPSASLGIRPLTTQWKPPRIRAIFCDANVAGESARTYSYFPESREDSRYAKNMVGGGHRGRAVACCEFRGPSGRPAGG